jgi:hypothetical protein
MSLSFITALPNISIPLNATNTQNEITVVEGNEGLMVTGGASSSRNDYIQAQ